jgi:hypothetical protein
MQQCAIHQLPFSCWQIALGHVYATCQRDDGAVHIWHMPSPLEFAAFINASLAGKMG